jgi:hypothetical protein
MPLNRVLLLVTARDRAKASQLIEPLRVGADRAVKALQADGAESRVLFPIAASENDASDYARILEEGLGNGVLLGGFDAAVELTAPVKRPLSALLGCLEEIREAAGYLIDQARSAALAGTDVMILKGNGPVRLVYGMRRRAGTTHRDFCRFWEKHYTSVTRFTPGLAGYCQLHGDPEASEKAARAAGVDLHDIDGVALHWYRSLEDFESAVALVGPLVPHAGAPVPFKEQALEAERQFSDLGRAIAIVATQV